MTGLYHGWDGEKDNHADFLHGGVDPSDFEEDAVRYRKKAQKKRPKKQRGCPENDFGPHVYVWAPKVYVFDWWPEYGLDTSNRYEIKTCCGCGKTTGKTRYTEEFGKRVAKMGWYKANYGDR